MTIAHIATLSALLIDTLLQTIHQISLINQIHQISLIN